MSRKLSPAGPASLLRTPASMSWLITCSSDCAAEPKRMIDWVFERSISALRRSISARRPGSALSTADQLALGLGQEVGGDRLDVLQRGFGLGADLLGHRHLSSVTAGDQPVLLQPFAQHLDLDVQIAAVVFEQMRARGW